MWEGVEKDDKKRRKIFARAQAKAREEHRPRTLKNYQERWKDLKNHEGEQEMKEMEEMEETEDIEEEEVEGEKDGELPTGEATGFWRSILILMLPESWHPNVA